MATTARRATSKRASKGLEERCASGGAAGRRPPRPDPRPRRARQQPQGCERRAPQAAADGVHRRLRLGQELARVRDHRRRVAASDQRDLQHVRARLHADDGPTRRRPTCWPPPSRSTRSGWGPTRARPWPGADPPHPWRLAAPLGIMGGCGAPAH